MTAFVVDLGGTRIKIGALVDGVVSAAHTMQRAGRPLAELLPEIAATLDGIADGLGIRTEDAVGLVFGFPGIVDTGSRRVVSTSGKYEDAIDIDLTAWANDRLGLPLTLENDARLALIGEWQHGAGRDFSDIVVVTLGTGLGTGVVSEGRVLRGANGTFGILGGHISVQVDGNHCPCGNTGCAEVEASSSVLPRLITEFRGGDTTSLGPDARYEDVIAAAEAGDVVARRIMDHTYAVWGRFVTNLIHAYNPARVVVGGGIARQAGVIARLRKAVAESAWTPLGEVEIVLSELGGDAALYSGEWLTEPGVNELRPRTAPHSPS